MPPGAFDAQGLGSLPDVKLERKVGTVTLQKLTQVENAVCSWLGL